MDEKLTIDGCCDDPGVRMYGGIAAGGYPAAEAQHAGGDGLAITVVPPGVDTDRFVPLSVEQRNAARSHFGFRHDDELVVGVSRLVPRKGFDTLIRAAAALARKHPHPLLPVDAPSRQQDA